MSAATYVNPFTAGAVTSVGRVDQGQDFNLKVGSPIRAIGKAKILEVQPNWYEGQPAVFYELLDGPRKGQILYAGEQITPTVTAGQVVPAGGTLGVYAPSGTGIEYGLGGGGGRTLSQATGGAYSGSGATPAGEQFAKFFNELGGSKGGGTSSGGSHCDLPGPLKIVCKPGELAQEGTEAALGLVSEGANKVGEEAVKGAIGLIKPIATKLTLYAVLILAALAMVVFGLSELLKPVGGPDLKGALTKATQAAAA